MKKLIAVLLAASIIAGCHNKPGKDNSAINGKREEISVGMNNTDQITEHDYQYYGVISQEAEGLKVHMEYSDNDDTDSCDHVAFDGTTLTFQTINQNNTRNFYTLKFDPANDLFKGEYKAWNGNTYQVRWERAAKK